MSFDLRLSFSLLHLLLTVWKYPERTYVTGFHGGKGKEGSEFVVEWIVVLPLLVSEFKIGLSSSLRELNRLLFGTFVK